MTHQEVSDLFQKEQVKLVTFTKKDGSVRVMKCTTNLGLIPKESHPKGTEKAKNLDVFNCWDLEAGSWRSFRIDSIIPPIL